VAIIIAANVGALAGDAINPTTGRVLLVATLLGAVGLLDDSGPIGPGPRLMCQALAAALILGAGVRFQLTGSPIADGAFSLIWMVGVTNAFNLLDNMDGLCGGTAALAALGVAGVALAGGQAALAVAAVAVAGACVGFLAFNLRPATIFMGDAGSLFLGAAVAALTLAAHPPGAASARFVVPILIIGLPLLDTTTVVLGRARRRISVLQGGRDHLSHRLVARGMRRRAAVRTLLLTESASAAVAVIVSRGLVNPWLSLAVVAVLLAAVWIWTTRARVYDDPVVGLPKVLRWSLVGGATVVVLLAAPAALAMARVRGQVQAGAVDAEAGIQHEQGGDTAAAAQDFARAATLFSAAHQRLNMIGVSAGRVVPVLAVNLRAAVTLTDVGLDLSHSGETLVSQADIQALRLQHGSVPLDSLARLAPRLRALSSELGRSSGMVHRLPRTLLLPEIRRAVDVLDAKLNTAARQTRETADAATIVPGMLGADGPRRYLLLIQNNAEARATGGLIGNFGELVAQSGQISLGRFGRLGELNAPEGTDRVVQAPADYLSRYARFSPFDLWQNVNLSPDFPTVGAVVAKLYPESGGSSVNGVVSVDPIALSDILRLTGPITVARWPTPITADNVVQVTLQGAYDSLGNTDRVAFLGDVAHGVFAAATTRDLGGPLRVVEALGSAVARRHLQLYSTNAAQQAFISRLNASGAISFPQGDEFFVTTQNASANKVDYYLKRSVNYQISIEPDSTDVQAATTARVHGTLTLALANDAPTAGHSSDALGPYLPGLQAGENRTFLSLYTPLTVTAGSLDGRPLPMESAIELGQHVYSGYVNIPAGATRTITYTLDGQIPMLAGGWYSLKLPQQPILGSDKVTVDVAVPSGWQFAREGGGGNFGTREVLTLQPDGPRMLSFEIRHRGPLSWLDPVSDAVGPPPGR
jgi:UDP-N-acetylmuramyl pentapeptide phosphotransferase/UDP-N-acetylglucosamine-1-phosphate transferase